MLEWVPGMRGTLKLSSYRLTIQRSRRTHPSIMANMLAKRPILRKFKNSDGGRVCPFSLGKRCPHIFIIYSIFIHKCRKNK